MPNNIDKNIIKSAYNKFRHDDNLTPEEEHEVTKFIDTVVICSSDPSDVELLLIRKCTNKRAVAERAVSIARMVNQHKHSRSCKKYGPTTSVCRFHYPKYPSTRTIITKSPELFYKEKLAELGSLETQQKWLAERMSSNSESLKYVTDSLSKFDNLEPDSSLLQEMKSTTTYQILTDILKRPDIQKHVSQTEDRFMRYEEALISSGKSSKTIILKRHPKIGS